MYARRGYFCFMQSDIRVTFQVHRLPRHVCWLLLEAGVCEDALEHYYEAVRRLRSPFLLVAWLVEASRGRPRHMRRPDLRVWGSGYARLRLARPSRV